MVDSDMQVQCQIQRYMLFDTLNETGQGFDDIMGLVMSVVLLGGDKGERYAIDALVAHVGKMLSGDVRMIKISASGRDFVVVKSILSYN